MKQQRGYTTVTTNKLAAGQRFRAYVNFTYAILLILFRGPSTVHRRTGHFLEGGWIDFARKIWAGPEK